MRAFGPPGPAAALQHTTRRRQSAGRV